MPLVEFATEQHPMIMRLCSLSLSRDLHELARETSLAPARYRDLRAAIDDGADGAIAKADALALVGSMTGRIERIRRDVVAADGLGDTYESVSELVLRAVRLISLTELTFLRPACVMSARGSSRARPAREFEAMELRLRAGLDEITHAWLLHRATQYTDREGYRAALKRAHEATRALADEPTVAAFLEWGLAAVDWPGLRDACDRLRGALRLHVNVDPEAVLVAWPAAASPSAMEHAS